MLHNLALHSSHKAGMTFLLQVNISSTKQDISVRILVHKSLMVLLNLKRTVLLFGKPLSVFDVVATKKL
jgi:DNA-binding transcriptional regulator/RsmH inhibitor MraZ